MLDARQAKIAVQDKRYVRYYLRMYKKAQEAMKLYEGCEPSEAQDQAECTLNYYAGAVCRSLMLLEQLSRIAGEPITITVDGRES